MIVGIDPGKCTGWAVERNSKIVACGISEPGGAALDGHFAIAATTPRPVVVIEEPRVVPGTPSARDIVQLAMVAGRWLERAHLHGIAAELVTPSTWKGQTPKEIHHRRALALLDDAERATIDDDLARIAPSKRHNAIDAVALVLWRAGRLRR